jgi:hypothetical protein
MKYQSKMWNIYSVPFPLAFHTVCRQLAIQELMHHTLDALNSWVWSISELRTMAYLSKLNPCNKDSASIVLVEVTKHPMKAARNPKMLKLVSVIDVSMMPPTTGTSESHTRRSKFLLQINHCKTTALCYNQFSEMLANSMKRTFINDEKYVYTYTSVHKHVHI